MDQSTRHEGLEGEVVVALVGQPVAVISVAPLVGDQPVLAELLEDLVHATAPDAGDGGDQGAGHQLSLPIMFCKLTVQKDFCLMVYSQYY